MNVYMVPIKVGIIIFPIIALLITLPYMIKQYHKFGSIPFLRTFIVYSFILYLLIAWFMVILPLPKIEEVAKMTRPWAQLVPFDALRVIIESTNFNILDFSTYIETLKSPPVYQMLFNIVLTIPFGIYLRYYFNRKWWEVLTFSFMLSFFFEVTQFSCLFGIYPRPYRMFDVDDLIVNTIGGMVGYFITPLFSWLLPSKDKLDEKAYIKGERVSFSRKAIATLIDFVIVSIITFSGVLERNTLDLSILMLVFLCYTIVFSVLLNGKTIGKMIVGIKIVSDDGKKARVYQILLRYLIKYVLYFEVYHATLVLLPANDIGSYKYIIILIVYIILLIIYLKSFINIFRKNKLQVYESLSHTKYVSTIKNKKIEEVKEVN